MKNVLSTLSLLGFFLLLGTILNGCSGDKNATQDLSYVEFSNTDKIKEDGKYYFYYGGEPFTGYIVNPYNTNQAVSRLSMVNNGQLTWEAMSGDIAFEPELQRTISVDIRYVLWCIDKLAGAKHIVDEMTLAR